MGKLCVGRMVMGVVETNCYFIYDEDNKKDVIVIDPAKDGVCERLNMKGFGCKAIFLTHGHFDHIMGVNELRDLTGAKVYALKEEAALLSDAALNASGQIRCPYTVTADVLLNDGEEVEIVSGHPCKVMSTPGHTAGSCCYYFYRDDVVITGDTLFAGSVGRTDLPTGDTSAIITSVRNLCDALPGHVKAYPGHGEETDIDTEKKYNPFVK